jgi:carboxymethylenebutenolidase
LTARVRNDWEAAMPISESSLDLQTPSGPMRCFAALPSGSAPAPGLIVVQEIFGVNASVQSACRRLAEAGFVALAPELFHRSAGPGETFPYQFQLVQGHFQKLTNPGLLEDLTAARDALLGHARVRKERLGIVGYCVGGFAAWLGAGRLGLQAAVPYYPGGLVNLRPGVQLEPVIAAAPGCPTLCFFGGKDASIPPSDVQAVREQLARIPGSEVVVYPDAGHAFCNPDRPGNYHAASAEASWVKALAFLQQHLG